MGTTATAKGKRTLQRRRIIQRPRLLALLDESNARVRMLVAAAGYGKTTLAEQWVAADGRRRAWYTVRRSSVDVAALALGIARACSEIVPNCDERLRAHLKAVSAPAGRSTVLAEILSEDVADWPSDAWLVVDDYQEIAGDAEAETFVADMVSGSPLQIVLTSRQRPSWVTARSILYGEVFEVGQASLSMDPQEAGEVLAGWSGDAASGLVALANGWPAVIGLASVSSAEIKGEGATVPESLYAFFAEEVFDALGDDVRESLTLLAVAPVVDRELTNELLGEERAAVVCDAAFDAGVLVERDSRLELHPLARSFLEERAVATLSRSAISTCLAHYRAKRDWDAAFDLIVRRELSDELPTFIEEALDDLLDSARLSTIHDWCREMGAAGVKAPIFALAHAEIALRNGRQARAQGYAELAAREPRLAFRSFSLAGRAAHLACHEQVALELYRCAEDAAESESDRRDAMWNQVMTSVELDPGAARKAMEALRAAVTPGSPREFVKATTCSLSLGTRIGALDLSGGAIAWELIPSLGDPLLETSFESIYSQVLSLSARYQEAISVAGVLLETAQRFRLDFALPHAFGSSALAHVGLRAWQAAESCLDAAQDLAFDFGDPFAQQESYAMRIRLLTQQGLHEAALRVEPPDLTVAVPVLRGLVLGSRALALAAGERLGEAEQLAKEAEASSRGIEATLLSAAVRAIVSLKRGQTDALKHIELLERRTRETGALDLLVTAYRAVPEILNMLMRKDPLATRTRTLLRSVGDLDLLQPLGVPDPLDNAERLSPREREVYELVCRGFSNRQIAEVLVISLATAKLHVQRIFHKLGVHSRNALAFHAALQRANHATSATHDDLDASEDEPLA